MEIITPNGIASTAALGTTQLITVERGTLHSIMHNDLINVFFNTHDFAECVIYTHVTGEVKTYKAIYDEPYVGVNPSSEIEVMSSTPTLRIRETQLARRAAKGDTVIVRGITFVVDSSHQDGVGTVTLTLQRRDRQ